MWNLLNRIVERLGGCKMGKKKKSKLKEDWEDFKEWLKILWNF